ncbi:MAG: glycosyltransferase family 2 protein [Patescibacteria group bacterium]
MKVFCVIPAYNEARSIVSVVGRVKPLVDEVIVVDDHSSDKTLELAQKTGAIVLHHIINRGQGAALQTGNDYALRHGADIIVHFDADGQFLAEEIKDIVQPIKNNQADIVFGSRFLGKKSNLPKFKKNIIMPLAKLINKVFFNINLSDPQNGFRAMSALVASEIRIENDGMAHCNEILIKSFKNKYRIQEVPITVIYHEFGQKFSGGIRIIKDLIYKKLTK